MIHMMIDLETASTSPRAAILQLGACLFDPEGGIEQTLPGFEMQINLADSLMHGLEIDTDTVEWWRRQDPEARAAVTTDPKPLHTVMAAFRQWYTTQEIAGVWAHGATFDPPILQSSFEAVQLQVPWRYNRAYDTRTMFWLARQTGWERSEGEVAHTGAADCRAQTRDLLAALAALS